MSPRSAAVVVAAIAVVAVTAATLASACGGTADGSVFPGPDGDAAPALEREGCGPGVWCAGSGGGCPGLEVHDQACPSFYDAIDCIYLDCPGTPKQAFTCCVPTRWCDAVGGFCALKSCETDGGLPPGFVESPDYLCDTRGSDRSAVVCVLPENDAGADAGLVSGTCNEVACGAGFSCTAVGRGQGLACAHCAAATTNCGPIGCPSPCRCVDASTGACQCD